MKVILNPPSADSPGYNRRMLYVADFEEAQKERKVTTKLYSDLLRFLSDYAEFEYAEGEPPHANKYDAMLELSENQTNELLAAFKGLSDTSQPMPEGMEGTKVDATVPPESSGG